MTKVSKIDVFTHVGFLEDRLDRRFGHPRVSKEPRPRRTPSRILAHTGSSAWRACPSSSTMPASGRNGFQRPVRMAGVERCLHLVDEAMDEAGVEAVDERQLVEHE